MIYVFDTSSLADLFKHFYRERFPSLWEKFDLLIAENRIISVSEVLRELESREDALKEWGKQHRELFPPPSASEAEFVRSIFSIPHFQTLIKTQARIQEKPVADPFVIAKAKILAGCVVTQEHFTENAARIPNVCKHFEIECTNLEGFMKRENWTF